jgi:hypothetical protein
VGWNNNRCLPYYVRRGCGRRQLLVRAVLVRDTLWDSGYLELRPPDWKRREHFATRESVYIIPQLRHAEAIHNVVAVVVPDGENIAVREPCDL